jgi:CNT family concentrative nucleoside transporter
VLKTGAGFSFFRYIADLAYDFLSEAKVGAQFFFDAETIAKNWFFVNTVRRQLLYDSPASLTDYSLHP